MMINTGIHQTFIKTLAFTMTVSGLIVGCGGVPEKDIILKDARDAYAEAKANPDTTNVEAMYDAKKALEKAEQAQDAEKMTHLAYLAQRQSQIAVAVGKRKAAETQRQRLVKDKNRVLIDARERQVAAKSRELEMATSQARRTRSQLLAEQAKTQQLQSQTQQLQKQLAELKGRQTARGLVLTLGDVLFETGKANLLSGATRNIGSVAAFLRQNPNRNVLVEGHTDNRGSEEYNLGLSQRRADSVRFALIRSGIASNRILARGIGENSSIASNSTETGRQQNRRVEITILNEGEILR